MGNIFKPLYRRARDKAYSLIPIRTCKEGFKFEGSLDRFENSADEIGTTIAIKLLAPQISRFVNAGANAGYFCLVASKLGISSIAFEPEAKMFKRLQRNLSANHSNCIPIPAALSDVRGTANFYGTGTAGSLLAGLSGTPSWDKQIVPTTKVDQFLAPTEGVELWLLDCEGAEPLIIKGAKNYLYSNKPILILEYEPSRDPKGWQEIIQSLTHTGYSHFIQMSELAATKEARAEEISNIANCAGDNILIFTLTYHKEIISEALSITSATMHRAP